MFIRFENKYSPLISFNGINKVIFFQHRVLCLGLFLIIAKIGLAQYEYKWNCINPFGDTSSFSQRKEAEQFMQATLEQSLRTAHATAHWELAQLDSATQQLFYTFHPGKIIYKGDIKGFDELLIDEEVLQRMLFWKTKTPFNSKVMEERVISDLKNAGLDVKNHQVFFTDSIADLRIQLSKIPRNQFQGLLGTINQENKTILIGEVKSQWVNSLKRAEKLNFHWQRQSISTQRLQCQIEFPVIFRSALGIQQKVELYRNQNLYFIVGAEGSLNYRLMKGGMLQAKYESKNHNSLLQSVTIQHRLVGLGLIQNTTIWNDVTFSINFSLLQGLKKTISLEGSKKDPLIKSQMDMILEKKWRKIFGSITLHQRGIYLQGSTAQIEKYRVGGVETLRGFGQESIFCQNYFGSQIESGWLINNIGQLFLFYDQGWIENSNKKITLWQGIGLGALFNVPDGQIEISSGWGIPDGQRLELRNNLIHIQYQVFF